QGKHVMRGAKRAVEAYLNLADIPVAHGGRYLWNWNDQPGRTASEVVEVLRATAIIEAAKEDAALLAEAGRA
ncbi:MAG TPA: hypothetical protein VJ782_02165, partial [Aeromicrobium sp.]|nr:hypothetical protein [Aeromicrobium sp.]